jgi:hypothetical protein
MAEPEGELMPTLDLSIPNELHLILRGEAENVILTTLRRWPHWVRVDIERDPHDSNRYIAVTLITDRVHETTLRDILRHSFRITFPLEGGDSIRRVPNARRLQ